MKAISLFSNIGIGETYLNEVGIDVILANEIDPKRSRIYEYYHPRTKMICGDITDTKIWNKIVDFTKKNKPEILISTPPCQGVSLVGKRDPNDPRNKLIIYPIMLAKIHQFDYILIENVPSILKAQIEIDKKVISVKEYIKRECSNLYEISFNILDAADYGTPQNRKRAIILLSKKGTNWKLPKKEKQITLEESIYNLPSLESGEKSKIKYHNAKIHNERHIICMENTPSGCTAHDNLLNYPKTKDGNRIKGYQTTYKRMSWKKPAPTVTMANASISSQNNVHPGKKMKNGKFSDARVLTLKEIMIVTGLPSKWEIPDFSNESEIRKLIGEGVPPMLFKRLFEVIYEK